MVEMCLERTASSAQILKTLRARSSHLPPLLPSPRFGFLPRVSESSCFGETTRASEAFPLREATGTCHMNMYK